MSPNPKLTKNESPLSEDKKSRKRETINYVKSLYNQTSRSQGAEMIPSSSSLYS